VIDSLFLFFGLLVRVFSATVFYRSILLFLLLLGWVDFALHATNDGVYLLRPQSISLMIDTTGIRRILNLGYLAHLWSHKGRALCLAMCVCVFRVMDLLSQKVFLSPQFLHLVPMFF
jgi:hypothetical protein